MHRLPQRATQTIIGLVFSLALCSEAHAQRLVPGSGQRISGVGDDFEDPSWSYTYNLPKSSSDIDRQTRLPAGISKNGRLFEPALRGQPDLIERVESLHFGNHARFDLAALHHCPRFALDAALSGVSMVPYIGDLAKAGKLPKYLKTVEKAILLADKSADAAKKLLPGMEKLQQALELLPAGANGYIDSIRTQVTAFVRKHGGRTKGLTQLPDISRHFVFQTIDQGDRVIKEASGRLGVPSKVKRHRKSDPSAAKAAQSGVSKGSGDHAGHLVADRFGAGHGAKNSSGLGTDNLSLQNWRMNSYGSWYELEAEWARKLELGHGFDVKIQDWYRKGENRPYKRTISGTETLPDGTKKRFNVEGEEGQVIYGNFETAKSRDAKGTNTVNPGGKKGKLIQGPWQPHE